MKTLFLPAIRMMNTLSFPRKFVVLGGLSLISLMIVSVVHMLHMSETINTATQQLKGLKQVQATSQLIQSLQLHRGASAGVIAGVRNNTNKQLVANEDTRKHIATVNELLPTELKESKEWATINARWKYLNVTNVTMGLNDSFHSHTKLLQRLFTFQRRLADYYQLPLVNELDTHYLTHSLLYPLPVTLELLGQIRAKGSSYLVHKSSVDKQKIKSLLFRVSIPFQDFKESIKKLESVITPSGKNVAEEAQALIQDIEHHLSYISNDALSAESDISPDEYYVKSTKVIDRGFSFLKVSLSSTLESLLKQRLEQAKNQLAISLGLAAILFLLVLYFLIGIYLSTRNTINTLTNATHEYYKGNFDQRLALSTDDELKDIAVGFNEMAEGFQKLLLEKQGISDQLRAIIDNSPIGIRFTGLAGHYYFVNKTFCNLVGIEEKAFLNTDANHLSEVLGKEMSQKCLTSDKAALEQDMPHVSYEEILGHDGKAYLLEITKVKLKSPEGETLGLIGISQDITEKRQQEDELKLADMVYKHSSEAMMITDSNNKIIAINPSLSDITGYAESELIGQNPKMLSSGKQSSTFYQTMWEEITLTGSWHGEIWNRRKNGNSFPEWLSINTIYDDHGEVYRRIALFSDITEKKQADELILRQANYDSLTNLPNRRMFNDRLNQEIKKSKSLIEKNCHWL